MSYDICVRHPGRRGAACPSLGHHTRIIRNQAGSMGNDCPASTHRCPSRLLWAARAGSSGLMSWRRGPFIVRRRLRKISRAPGRSLYDMLDHPNKFAGFAASVAVASKQGGFRFRQLGAGDQRRSIGTIIARRRAREIGCRDPRTRQRGGLASSCVAIAASPEKFACHRIETWRRMRIAE
jgi:hypothetical protein